MDEKEGKEGKKERKKGRFECGTETTASKTSYTVCCQCFHPLDRPGT